MTTFPIHRLLFVFALTIVSLIAPRPDALAKSISVLAVVDGAPITSIDFEERRNFLVKTTGISDTAETKDQIDSDVLQMLIDDMIKIKEGLSLGNNIEAIARQRARELVMQSFSQNGEDPIEVMERLGIDPAVAEEKFLADVLWASTIQSVYAKQFSSTQDEAEKELERIKQNIKKPHADIDEIILLPEPKRSFAETKKLAEQIHAALLKGADFGRIAQQYSASGSSRQGGKLGWVLIDRLPEKVRNVISDAPTGTITAPIEIDGSIAIFRVKSRRVDGNVDPLEAKVTILRLVQPMDMNPENNANIMAARDQLASELESIYTCDDFANLHNQLGSGINPQFATITLGELPQQLQQIIAPLNTNEKSDVINFVEGLVAFMVCDKALPTVLLPELQDIEVSIRNKYFTTLSARHLSRLRKKAIISYQDEN